MVSRQFTLMRLFFAISLFCLSLASITFPDYLEEPAIFIGSVAACAAIGVLVGGWPSIVVGSGIGLALSFVLYFVLSLLAIMSM